MDGSCMGSRAGALLFRAESFWSGSFLGMTLVSVEAALKGHRTSPRFADMNPNPVDLIRFGILDLLVSYSFT